MKKNKKRRGNYIMSLPCRFFFVPLPPHKVRLKSLQRASTEYT